MHELAVLALNASPVMPHLLRKNSKCSHMDSCAQLDKLGGASMIGQGMPAWEAREVRA